MTRAQLLEALREILHRFGAGEVREGLALGEGGLALDSIAVAEVLLECESRFGAPAAPLLDGRPVTVGRIVDYWQSAPQ